MSIFSQIPNQTQNNGSNNMLQTLNNLKSMINGTGGNAQMFAQMMMKQNPQFRAFVNEFQNGATVEQVAQKYGLDINQLKQLVGK